MCAVEDRRRTVTGIGVVHPADAGPVSPDRVAIVSSRFRYLYRGSRDQNMIATTPKSKKPLTRSGFSQ